MYPVNFRSTAARVCGFFHSNLPRGLSDAQAQARRRDGAQLIENLETRRLMAADPSPLHRIIPAANEGPAIESFSLVSAKDDSVIRPINDGDVIDLSALGLSRKDVNVRANFASGTSAQSVKYDVSGATDYHHVENHAGYYLFGGKGSNVGGNNGRLALGRNVVTAAAYTQKKAHGQEGSQQTFTFDLVDNATAPGSGPGAGNAVGQIESVMLADTASGREFVQLDGYQQVIDLGTVRGSMLNVVAHTVGPIGSVTFSLNGQAMPADENDVPYALFGDTAGHLNPGSFAPGLNTLTLFPYSGPNGTGTAGPIVMLSFTVGA